MAVKNENTSEVNKLMELKDDFKKRQKIAQKHPELSYMIPDIQPLMNNIKKISKEIEQIENKSKMLRAQLQQKK